MPRLKKKTALITGGTRVIGAAIANAFRDEGADVILTDIDAENGQAMADQIGATFARLDVASEADWNTIAERFPDLDVLVNTDGTFLGCRYAIRAMRANGAGSIVNISSRSGLVGIPMAVAYAASKAAIRNHTKSVALYCAAQGLNMRCNSIHPAATMTPIWEPMLGNGPDRAEREAAMVADTPMRRFGEAKEVAALAVLLASDEAAYMIGSELTIDGGILAGSAATLGD